MKIPRDRNTLLAAGATFVVLTGGWFALISPALAHHGELVTQTEASQSSSNSMRARLPMLRAQLEGIAPRVDELRTLGERVTATIDQPALLEQLRAIAAASGIDGVRNVEVGLPSMVTAQSAPTSPVSAEGMTAEDVAGDLDDPLGSAPPSAAAVLASYNVTMEVHGSEPQVRDFLTGLQQAPRLVVVTSSSMQLSADGTATMRIDATYFLQQVDVEGLASQIETLVERDSPTGEPSGSQAPAADAQQG